MINSSHQHDIFLPPRSEEEPVSRDYLRTPSPTLVNMNAVIFRLKHNFYVEYIHCGREKIQMKEYLTPNKSYKYLNN